MRTDYTVVTELPGIPATQDQLSRLYHRYRTAANYCDGKDVLEVGCGGGQGLGYLAKRTRLVVGGDYETSNLTLAKQYYKDRMNLVRLDAHHLPFPNDSFDVVILFETIYYLASVEKFLDETRRVLRTNGALIICTVNKDWTDFNPSPFSVRYPSAPELAALLREKQFEVKLFGAYLTESNSTRERIVSLLKRTAVSLHLVPRTMNYKAILKRIFIGKLTKLPAEVSENGMAYDPPTPISCEAQDFRHKILYAVGYAQTNQA